VNDIKFTIRQLLKNPGFTAVAVLTLGLGIGAATAMFGLIQGVLLSPPPYYEPDRLVLVSPARIDGQPFQQGCTIGQWLEWQKATDTIHLPALYSWTFNFWSFPKGANRLSPWRRRPFRIGCGSERSGAEWVVLPAKLGCANVCVGKNTILRTSRCGANAAFGNIDHEIGRHSISI
jgi:hypothetical protein